MEERILNGAEVIELSTGKKLKIDHSIETNNQFGYGIYLYRFKGLLKTGFGLYKSEIKEV